EEHCDLERLAQKPGADRSQMIDGALAEEDAGDEENLVGQARIDALDLLRQDEAIHVGQEQIENDHRVTAILHLDESVLAVGRRLDGVAATLEGLPNEIEHRGIVVDEEDFRGRWHGSPGPISAYTTHAREG